MTETSLHFRSMDNDDWGTPLDIVRRAAEFLGGEIELDPASSFERNKVVGAKKWLGKADARMTGIPEDWGNAKSLFINPPGGKQGSTNKTLAKVFFRKAVQHCVDNEARFVWVAYNINQLQTLQREYPEALRSCFLCVPEKRVAYNNANGVPVAGAPGASAILALSGLPDDRDRFCAIFGSLGATWLP